jgi:hypothetical protein
VPANPIPRLKKEWQTNPLVTLKKNRFDFCGDCFSQPGSLMAGRNRSAGQKNSPNTDGTRFLLRCRNTTEIEGEMDASVTTSHLGWPNEHRRAGSLLPIWLPNPTFLALNCPRPLTLRSRGRLLGLHQKGRFMTPCQSETKTKNHQKFRNEKT